MTPPGGVPPPRVPPPNPSGGEDKPQFTFGTINPGMLDGVRRRPTPPITPAAFLTSPDRTHSAPHPPSPRDHARLVDRVFSRFPRLELTLDGSRSRPSPCCLSPPGERRQRRSPQAQPLGAFASHRRPSRPASFRRCARPRLRGTPSGRPPRSAPGKQPAAVCVQHASRGGGSGGCADGQGPAPRHASHGHARVRRHDAPRRHGRLRRHGHGQSQSGFALRRPPRRHPASRAAAQEQRHSHRQPQQQGGGQGRLQEARRGGQAQAQGGI